MFCQYCLSSTPYLMVDMSSTYYEQNELKISYLECFTQCKQIKVEDEQNAKICTICLPILSEEYASVLKKNDQYKTKLTTVIKQEPETEANYEITIINTEENLCVPKQEESSIETRTEQVIFCVSEVKHEPELLIEDDEVINDATPLQSNTKEESIVSITIIYFEFCCGQVWIKRLCLELARFLRNLSDWSANRTRPIE
jgi:hypothetical protein